MKVLAIDAYNMLHRARFGYGSGPHSTTFNFFRSLRSEIERHDSDIVYIVTEGRPEHRIKINKDYKGNRSPVLDDNFHRQKRDIFDLCKLLPVKIIRHPDYECDDVIGHICMTKHMSDEVTIVSSDTDFIQLLNYENVSLWNPIKKVFIEKWPVDYVTWKALKGDPTDNIPGIKGIGEKRAFSLASNVSTLNDMLEKDPEKKRVYEAAYAQIQLMDFSINDKKIEEDAYAFDSEKLYSEFKERDFKSIVGKSWLKWLETMEKINVRDENYA
jgi:DNA polymerase-1|tara:strand:- start:466 stop:1278 length:813 start_codon:yes stop_codon:yes gene_type:complete